MGHTPFPNTHTQADHLLHASEVLPFAGASSNEVFLQSVDSCADLQHFCKFRFRFSSISTFKFCRKTDPRIIGATCCYFVDFVQFSDFELLEVRSEWKFPD